VIEGDGVRLRRAEPADVEFLSGLLSDPAIEPYLAAVTPRDSAELLEEIERSKREPGDAGRFVIEVEEGGEWRPAGTLRFELRNRRSRIASLGALAVAPAFRGHRVGDSAAQLIRRHLIFDLDFHRLELEIYGFNERAIAHAERVGFVKEGVKRKAYRRRGEWVDGVIFGLVREDLDDASDSSL
jgi:RimJ/RimL family protein N-acetyltransferase